MKEEWRNEGKGREDGEERKATEMNKRGKRSGGVKKGKGRRERKEGVKE